MRKSFRKILNLFKQLLVAAVFLLGCIRTAKADPASTTLLTSFLISLAVSAATTAATYFLTAIFTPKPKPIDKDKLQGSLKASNVGEGLTITEIYGDKLGDGLGGIEVGGIYFYLSNIRKTEEVVPGGGGGGGKGGPPSAPRERRFHYFVDVAVMFGRGPLKYYEIKAGTDVLYQNFPVTATGTTYEAETATLTGGAVAANDASCSNGQKVTNVGLTGKVAFSNVVGETGPGLGFQPLYVLYKSSADKNLNLKINNVNHPLVLPNSYGNVENAMLSVQLGLSNTIELSNTDALTADIDGIVIGPPIIIYEPCPRCDCVVSGARDPNYVQAIPTYNMETLFDPMLVDDDSCREFNYQPNANSRGELEVDLINSFSMRLYEGNTAQLPDATLQAYFEAAYGAGATPAFRNRAYIMLTDFEITKYRALPNITAVVGHKTIKNLGAMYDHRAKRAGLTDDEINFDDLYQVPLRAYAITDQQAPRNEMEILNRIFDVDTIEDIDGQIRGVIPSETVAARIPLSELQATQEKSASEDDAKVPNPVQTIIKDEYQCPRILDASFFDAQNGFEVGNVHSIRENTVSSKHENIELGVTLTRVEAQRFCDRDFQKSWVEKDALQISTFSKYAFLKPTDLIEVQQIDGSYSKMRIKAIQGGVPGALAITGVSRDVEELPPRVWGALAQNTFVKSIEIPGHAIGTVFDGAILRSSETVPGVYVGCALRDQHYAWKGAALVWERASGFQKLDDFPNQATIGRTIVGVNGVVPPMPTTLTSGYDTTSSVTFDLFYGEVETKTIAELNEGENLILVGNELLAFRDAVRVNGFKNRWTVSHFKRGVKDTPTETHDVTERVMLLNSAVKFVPLELGEVGKTRTFKFVTTGQPLISARSFDFNWMGETKYRTPVYDLIDAARPLIGGSPSIYSQDGNWVVMWQKPQEYGFWADNAEVRFVKVIDKTFTIGAGVMEKIDVGDNTVIPANGRIILDNEVVSYLRTVGDSANVDITARGLDGTTDADHTAAQVKAVVKQLRLGNITSKTEPKFSFDCEVSYRWRNRNRTESDGWSGWSGTATAYGLASAVLNTGYAEIAFFDNDPIDGNSPSLRQTKWGK